MAMTRSDFDITGGVLSFNSSPSYETPKGSPAMDGGDADRSYEVEVVATEVRAPGSLEIAQNAFIKVTVNVKNIEEDPSLTLNRLQVRAGVEQAIIMADLDDPDEVDGDANYQWYVPKVSRPDLQNEDHWIEATGGGAATATTVRSQQTSAGFCAWLRRTPTGSETTTIWRTPRRLTP